MSNYYPIGKAAPPPPQGGGGWGGASAQGGGWGAPPNAYSGGGWAAPTGAWAQPSGAWGGAGGTPTPSSPGQANPFSTSAGSDSPEYQQAIEYFRSLSDQDVIPEDGRVNFNILAGTDGAIDAYELQDILNKVFLREFKFDGFSADMTRSLVAMRDYDLSGKLGFNGFRALWTDLAWCKRAFGMLDKQNDGAFSNDEFGKALSTMGLTVTPKTQKAMLMRYSDKGGNIRFDDFVLCYIRLKTMMTTFQEKDPQGIGSSEFERDEFVQLSIYT